MVRRSEKALEEYEARLHLVDRFLKIRAQIDQIRGLTDCSGGDAGENLKKIRTIAEEIRREL